jgi:hypothetical protein
MASHETRVLNEGMAQRMAKTPQTEVRIHIFSDSRVPIESRVKFFDIR